MAYLRHVLFLASVACDMSFRRFVRKHLKHTQNALKHRKHRSTKLSPAICDVSATLRCFSASRGTRQTNVIDLLMESESPRSAQATRQRSIAENDWLRILQ